jgi:hypothetical protein
MLPLPGLELVVALVPGYCTLALGVHLRDKITKTRLQSILFLAC